MRAHRRAVRLRVAAAFVLVAVLVAIGTSVYRSEAFAVRKVDVVGTNRLTAEQVRSLARIPEDSTLLRLPIAQIESNLARSAWIASADVSRDFPDTVRIRVVERVPAAVVDLGGKALWLIDGSGTWLSKLSAETTAAPVAIRGVEGLDPVAGRRTGSETLLNALEIVRQLDPALSKLVRTISAPSIDKTALVTTDDVEIFVGSSEDIERKQQVAEKILKQQAGKVVYINVRTVDRPTWRGLDADK